MSTVQQVKQITKTDITTEQSQKLIQTMLTMSFGCLAFLRGLFPDDSFVDQKFVPEKCNKSYDKANASSIRIKTLVRGKSDEADMFLDWLEKGVFTAIKKRYLRAISLGIFTDKKNPHDLVESYVFSLSYPTPTSVSLRINEHEEAFSLLHSRKMMQQLMRRFIIITQSLDPLPKERYLTMRLLFNDHAPANYQPQFFKDASLEPVTTIKVPSNTDMDTVSIGSLNTPYHTLGLRVLSLVDVETEERENPNTKAVDPFNLLDEPVDLKVGSIDQDKYNSQTTNMLENYLKSSPEKISPTQAIYKDQKNERLECDCGMSCGAGSVKRCSSCGRVVHGLCYGNSKSLGLQKCITCLFEKADSTLDFGSRDFKLLMTLRRVFRYIKNKPDLNFSVSSLQSKIFAENNDQNITELLNDALSIFIQDDLIIVEQERRRNAKGQFTKDSTYVEIDRLGIFMPTGPISIGRHVFTLQLNSKNAQKCYTELAPNSYTQVEEWMLAIKTSLSHLIKNKSSNTDSNSSLNFSSLAIQDSDEHTSKTSKRDNSHLSEDVANIIHSDIPCKVRKISVSKRTLRSAW